DLLLARTLSYGDTATLEYVTSFSYQQVPPDELTGELAEYRRAVRRGRKNVDNGVRSARGALPATVWWAIWDGIGGEIVDSEPVSLDAQHSAHRFLRFLENTVVGVHWVW